MTATRVRELTAATAATAAIGLLVIGVPAALITAVGWPLASWRLAVDGLRYGQVSEDLLLAALTAVVWIAWAQLTAALAVEAVAVARGRIATRRRVLGVMQPVAARLISAALLVSATIGARPATAVPAGSPTPVAATATAAPIAFTAMDTPTGIRHIDAERERAATPRPVYRVRRHDTLWGIAERRLGDGRRWREIHALNIGRTQPDGRALAADDDAIDVGWRLVMPADDPGDDPPPPDAVTVGPGDTLSQLADEHLGDLDAWPQLYAANVGRTQPDGRTLGDPDVLLVGWRIDIPDATTVDDQRGAVRPSGIAPLDPGDRRQLHPPPSHPPPDADPPVQPEDLTAPRSRSDQPADAATGRNGDRPTTPTRLTPAAAADGDDQPADHEGEGREWWWILAGTGMLAAGVAATLARLRGVWLRRRSVGDQRTPPPPEATAQAATLAAEATPHARARAVRAVRAYAAGVADLDQPPPVVAGVTLDPAGTIAVLLHDTAPDQLPDGWARDPSDPRQVQLPAATDPPTAAASGGPVGAALVTVGIGVRSHRRLLLNLETCRSLALDGPDDLTTATMLAWAVELATSGHADALDVWLVGFDLDTPADAWERLHPVDDVDDAIDWLRATALGDTTPTALPGRGDPDWIPQVVLCAPTLAPAAVETLISFVRPYHPAGVAIVTANGTAAAAWRIEVAAERHTITSLRDPVALHPTRRITREEFTAITGLVAASAGDAATTLATPVPPPGSAQAPSAVGLLERIALPATPAEVRQTIDEHRDDLVIVRLLGPVRVATPDGGQVPGGRLTEAVAYLACHRTGVSTDQLVDVLWHGGAATLQRLSEVMSRVRAALGGTRRLPRRDTTGGYRVAATVVTDLELIAAHVRRAQRHPDTMVEELSAAVELICGRPFADADWPWATVEGLATDAAAVACDVACVLGQWHLEHGDPAAALRVARCGLRAAPESEQLARLRMRAYHQRGEPDQLRAVMDDLRAAADLPGPDGDDQLHPDTIRLYRTLTNT